MEVENPFNLKGKSVIITGAARGIGKSISLAMAKSGASIAVVDLLAVEAEETVAEIKSAGSDAVAIQADLTIPEEVERMVTESAAYFGGIDVLVNNAGITNICQAEDYTLEDFNRVLNINLISLFQCSQVAGREMIRQGSGNIVNIASIAGLVGVGGGISGGAAYHSSKAGVIGLTRQLAAEWGKHNITVNAVCPGIVLTEMTQDRSSDQEFKDFMFSRMPLQRLGVAEDITGAVIFLASKAASWITGQSIVIDGGYTAL